MLDPTTQPRGRGFDFTKDYVAWNTLANRLYKRRQFEPPGSDTRREFLLRAVRAAERVLELDAEDVTAHDLLALAYGELSNPLAEVQPPAEVSADWALSELSAATDSKQPAQRRIEACANLAAGLPKLATPKLATMRGTHEAPHRVPHAEPNADVNGAIAGVLAVYHRESM